MRPLAVTVRVKSLEMGSRSQNSEIELVVEFLDFFISFGTIFWDIILGWYYNILGWKFIIIYFLTGKLRKNQFWTNKKFVYLLS